MDCPHCGTTLRTYKPTYYVCPQEDPGALVDGPEHTPERCRDHLTQMLGISTRNVRELKASLAYLLDLRDSRVAFDPMKYREARLLVLEE